MKSKKFSNLNISPEDIYTSLGQKGQAIFILEKEVQELKGVRERYERLRDQKQILDEKCRRQTKENEYLKERNYQKMTFANKNCEELKNLIDSLERDLKSKNNQLKSAKLEVQNQLNFGDQCSQEIKEKKNLMDDMTNNLELLKMEKQRIKDQQALLLEELQKSRYCQRNIQNSTDKIKNKIYNIQAYLRDLCHEEQKISETLALLEDENNSIDMINEDLESLISTANGKQRQCRQQLQKMNIDLKSRQLEKGRMMKEFNEKVKLLKNENDKTRNLTHMIESKLAEVKKVSHLQRQVKQEVDIGIKNNLQVEDINFQLKKDLAVCQKHLENVLRNNKGVSDNLDKYKATNKVVIKKLQKPTGQSWVSSFDKENIVELYETNDEFIIKK